MTTRLERLNAIAMKHADSIFDDVDDDNSGGVDEMYVSDAIVLFVKGRLI